VDSVVAVSDRISLDLKRRTDLQNNKLTTIFNGIDVEQFKPTVNRKCYQGPLRVIYLGRFEDGEKGIFFIPSVLKEAIKKGIEIRMDFVGYGTDKEKLSVLLRKARVEIFCRILEPVKRMECSTLLNNYDCILMPSRSEGCGYSLIEGMACGCVPVASNIWGSIGTIIEDNVSGFLVPVGDVKEFSKRLVQLYENRQLLFRMSSAAVERIRTRFTLEIMTKKYMEVFKKVLSKPPLRQLPESLDNFKVPQVLRPRPWNRLPQPLKNILRKWVVRFGGTV